MESQPIVQANHLSGMAAIMTFWGGACCESMPLNFTDQFYGLKSALDNVLNTALSNSLKSCTKKTCT
jgi:hypothetical protein